MMDFTSVHNIHERAVYDAVQESAERYPGIAKHADLLADVACVALNRMTPRYIRHAVDLAGVKHVALGSDFDGAIRVPFDTTGLVLITQGLTYGMKVVVRGQTSLSTADLVRVDQEGKP